MVTASSKSGLEVSRQRQLWKRAILLVRIVVILLPERLKLKQERRGVRNICCSDTNLISDDGPLNSSSDGFYYKRAMFEKYVKMRESINKQAKPFLPVQSPPVAQVQSELTQEYNENSTTAKTDGSLVGTHLDKMTDTLKQSLEIKMDDDDDYNEKNQPISSELETLESQMKRKVVQHQWAFPKPATQSLNTFMDHQSRHSHGDGTKENVTAQTPFFCVADEHDRNSQTLWDAKPVTLAENDQSLRLETANIKDNGSQEDPHKPKSPVKGKGACMEMVDGVTTPGDISVEMTEKKKCQAITLSQEQTLSVGPVEVLTPAIKHPLKSTGAPDTCFLASTEAKAQDLDKAALHLIAPNLELKYWEQHMKTPTLYCKSLQMHTPDQSPSKKRLEKETPLLKEGRTLTVRKEVKDKLAFNIKHKVLYQLWGLPLVVQRSLDTIVEMLPKPSEQEMDRTPRQERTPPKSGICRNGL